MKLKHTLAAATLAAALASPPRFDLGAVQRQYVHIPRAIERKAQRPVNWLLPMIGGCCCGGCGIKCTQCTDKTPLKASVSVSGITPVASGTCTNACSVLTNPNVKLTYSGSIQAASGCITCNGNACSYGCPSNLAQIGDLFSGSYGAQGLSSCSGTPGAGKTYAALTALATAWWLAIWVSSDGGTTGAIMFLSSGTANFSGTCKNKTLTFNSSFGIGNIGSCYGGIGGLCSGYGAVGTNLVCMGRGGSAVAVLGDTGC